LALKLQGKEAQSRSPGVLYPRGTTPGIFEVKNLLKKLGKFLKGNPEMPVNLANSVPWNPSIPSPVS